MTATRSKLYWEMHAKFGERGMDKAMTFGQACDIIGVFQEGAVKALGVQREAIEALKERIALIEAQAGYEVVGHDKDQKPRIRANGRRAA